MKRKIFSILFVLVLVLSFSLVTAVPASAAIINVPTNYATIQAAIDAANPYDTIIVGDGTYNENIVVNKSLTIQAAASAAVIDGLGTMWVPAVEITAADVTLEGFTIQNFKADTSHDFGAVFVNQGDGATIQDNTVLNITTAEANPFGIGIDVAANNVDVIGNTVHDVGSIGIRVYGPGTATTGVLVENNVVYQTGNTGVVFANAVVNSIIRGNHLYDSALPTPYNLLLCWGFDKTGPPSDILIEGNNIHGGYGNIVLAGAEHITITGNTITGAVPLTTNGKNIYILSDYLQGVPQGAHYLSTDIVITNNDITGAEGYGVRIAYTGTGGDPSQMAATTTIMFNNISGNTDYGVENNIATDVDATHNWWDDASGPYHATTNPGGTGDEVSDNVDYSPWLGAPVVVPSLCCQTLVGTATHEVDAIAEADTEATLSISSETDIFIVKYQSQPFPEEPFPDASLGKFIDIYLSNPAVVYWPIYVEVYYTDGEVRAAGIAEGSLGLYYYESPDTFHRCSDTDVDIANNIIWANVTAAEAGYLVGTPFGGGGNPRIVGGTVYPVDKVSILMPWIGLAVALALAGVFITRFARRKVRG